MTEDKKKIYWWVSNGIGNFVMMTPGMQACSQLGFEITAGVDTGWKRTTPLSEALNGCPFVSRLHYHPEESIQPTDYDYIALFDTQEKNDFTRSLIGLKNTHRFKTPKWEEISVHEVDYFMSMSRELGYKEPPPSPFFPVSDSIFLSDGPRISIAFSCLSEPGWEKKRWIKEKWASLVNYLGRYYEGVEICMIAGKEELIYCNEILDGVDYTNVVNYVGETSITETAQIIRKSNLLISIDNGLSHIASAVGTHVIAIYGPTLVSKNRPYTDNLSLVSSNIECSPCFRSYRFNECKSNRCMELVSVGDVFNEVRKSGKL